MFYIPLESAEYVNELVDRMYVHDLGRILPSIGIYIQDLDERYLTVKQKEKKGLVKDLKEAFTKVSRKDFADAFFLHHAVDLLSLRISSALLIGERLDYRISDMTEGVCLDLNGIQYDVKKFCERRHLGIGPSFSKSLDEEIRSKLPQIIKFPELLEWIEDKIVQKRRKLDDMDYIKGLFENEFEKIVGKSYSWSESMKKVYKVSGLNEVVEEVAEANRKRYEFGSIKGYVSKLALYSSRIIDYFFVTKLSSEMIKEELFSKRSSLSSWAVDHLIDFPDQAYTFIERDLRKLEKAWLQKYGLKLPEENIRKYYEVLKMGFNLVQNK